MAAPGSYVLVVDCDGPVDIEVGALGEIAFDGPYAYVGSAFGPGGLSRVDRHQELAAGERDTRHWHIDYLLGDGAVRLAAVETYPDRDIECALAMALREAGCEPVADFGASDCDCGSHLWELEALSLPATVKTL
jgi:Uri superfamily endonuclease